MSAEMSVPQESPAETAQRLQDEVNTLARFVNSQAQSLPLTNADVYCEVIHAVRHLSQASNSLASARRRLEAMRAALAREVGR